MTPHDLKSTYETAWILVFEDSLRETAHKRLSQANIPHWINEGGSINNRPLVAFIIERKFEKEQISEALGSISSMI